MKKSHNGFAWTVGIILGGLILVGIVAGLFFLKQPKKEAVINAPATLPMACSDFSAFSSIVLGNLSTPYVPGGTGLSEDSFEWLRNASEPFVEYPVLASTTVHYVDPTETSITTSDGGLFYVQAVITDGKNLESSLDSEALKLGLEPDSLNTIPAHSYSFAPRGVLLNNFSYLQTFGFRKGEDLYSVVLRGSQDNQAPGWDSVAVTCGAAVPAYDALYNALSLKSTATSSYEKYQYEYVNINEMSRDQSVFYLSGELNQAYVSNYYLLSGTSTRLVSQGSGPAVCSVLESQKVGKGMKCQDDSSGINNVMRIVTY